MRAVACIRTSKLFAASVGIAAIQAGATADLEYQGVGPDCPNLTRNMADGLGASWSKKQTKPKTQACGKIASPIVDIEVGDLVEHSSNISHLILFSDCCS